MPNIGTLLKDEIARLCRKEIRRNVEPIRKASAVLRRDIAALKRKVVALERQGQTLAKQAKRSTPSIPESSQRPMRFVAKGLRSLRARLGLSAGDLGLLLGVSGQSVYNWEQGKTVPGKAQLATLATIRSIGKREANERLTALK
jgi:DNA-binding transcriptional regulator YiaG